MENKEVAIGDYVTLKKPHTSQTKEWLVIRNKPVLKLKSTQYPNLIIILKKEQTNTTIKTIRKPNPEDAILKK